MNKIIKEVEINKIIKEVVINRIIKEVEINKIKIIKMDKIKIIKMNRIKIMKMNKIKMRKKFNKKSNKIIQMIKIQNIMNVMMEINYLEMVVLIIKQKQAGFVQLKLKINIPFVKDVKTSVYIAIKVVYVKYVQMDTF